MIFKMGRYLLFAIFLGILCFGGSNKTSAQEDGPQSYKVRLYLFHSESCPHCHEEIAFLDDINKKIPNLEVFKYEVSNDFKNLNLFKNIAKIYSLGGGVPVTIIGDEVIVGFDSAKSKGKQIADAIAECSKKPCNSKADDILGQGNVEKYEGNINENNTTLSDKNTTRDGKDKLTFNFFGKEFCLETSSSVCLMGVVLGLADGINPCMFSVLLFMLTYLLAIGSRRRALKSGIAFIITTFAVYFLFMYGIIKIVDVLQIAQFMRYAVIAIAFVAGLIMVKDYFFYGKGISLEIPRRYKPKMQQMIKKGTVPSAIVLAVFSSIVELPCTSGLPLAYTSILSSKQLYPFWYLFIYNLFFVLPLAIILIFVVVSWKKVENIELWRNSAKKYMRLVSGILLLMLAIALWFNWI